MVAIPWATIHPPARARRTPSHRWRNCGLQVLHHSLQPGDACFKRADMLLGRNRRVLPDRLWQRGFGVHSPRVLHEIDVGKQPLLGHPRERLPFLHGQASLTEKRSQGSPGKLSRIGGGETSLWRIGMAKDDVAAGLVVDLNTNLLESPEATSTDIAGGRVTKS